MTNGTDHQRFHEIAFKAKKRLAWAIEQAVREGGDTEDCACVRDLAEAFAILPLPHAHDGGRAHTHPAPPMAHSMIEVMPLPPELEERLDDLLEQAGSEVSPEALRDQLQDLQRAVSAAVLALARAVRDGARDGATAANCRCLRQGGGDPDALAGPDGRRDDAAHPRQHAGRCTGISFDAQSLVPVSPGSTSPAVHRVEPPAIVSSARPVPLVCAHGVISPLAHLGERSVALARRALRRHPGITGSS